MALPKDSLLLKQQFCNILLQCSYAKCAVRYLLYLKKEEFCHLFSAVCGVGFFVLGGVVVLCYSICDSDFPDVLSPVVLLFTSSHGDIMVLIPCMTVTGN